MGQIPVDTAIMGAIIAISLILLGLLFSLSFGFQKKVDEMLSEMAQIKMNITILTQQLINKDDREKEVRSKLVDLEGRVFILEQKK